MNKLVFVGAGSMAEAMISGVIENRLIETEKIWVTNRTNKEKLTQLQQKYGVTGSYDLPQLFAGAEAVILAMKPKDAASAITQIAGFLTEDTLIISFLAGVSIQTIEVLSGKSLAIARAMPNTSAAVGKSATAIAVNDLVKAQQIETIKQLFETIGFAAFVTEDKLDAVTGLSGSGPAYIYYLVEAMEKAAFAIGLEEEMAKKLIINTFIGAAEMVKSSSKPSQQLRKEVTSPGGTTEAGIKILEENHVQQAFIDCIQAAAAQSKKLGDALSKELHALKHQ
ncbi:pyrroline-5-carboxylate reductase [Pullulanibacillus sp. KACC 23026]|uniref:pyrroline-5-carboxylate reductase n=1 Tax=Pullulanibacillus sp. KACC 23026 TaxID=3028315 RepID=UPI0023B1A47D|nr:pyrroline-5-carboxylate reductase [Pullulanibacillus sp. KACC 23026]WEG10985.1 pyrroline-5-carboxylate reductase [Pullulanibacillus sp. KACC 23026]